ncbi:YhgE/Pip domain-containing protein [Loigolactobacillus bifermentans]|uniref:Autotransport protein n=1 Tax=Loigolactobacillus bifermentans DSM 20003 TaxID=1423726 RepID=A0A0R1GEP6_9LACO|nr:YhgE/Pip domain-containing protein [Loigolactobacillus bifermentans]KRK32512.1 autotransport protein [Loigolactobacillus bifermentans DSM 20003]QGG60189.1 autotransporter [Loigolactobacillus bifermentans]
MQTIKNHSRQILLLGLVVVIPLLLLFIAMNFVSYEQRNSTSNINVAVVDNDQNAKFQGKVVALGTGVEKKLKHNHQVTWHFVSEATADKKLEDGTYLMKVTLPRDFSKNATTALSKKPKTSQINVSLSDHNNFASHLITSQVADKLRSEVVANVQQAYDQTMLSSIKQLGTGVSQAHDGTKKLKSGTDQLLAGNKKVASNLETLADKMVEFKAGGKTLEDGLITYTDGVDTLAAGNVQLNEGLKTLQSSTPALASGVQQLASGSNTLNTGIGQYTTGVGQYTTGVGTYVNGVGQYTSGVNKYATGVNQYTSGVSQLNSGLSTLSANSSTLNNGTNTLASAGKQMPAAIAGLAAYNGKINSGLNEVNEALSDNASNMSKLSTETAKFDSLIEQAAALKTQVDQAKAIEPELNKMVTLLDGLQTAKTSANDLMSKASELTSAQATIKSSLVQIGLKNGMATGLQRSEITTAQKIVDDPDASATIKQEAQSIVNSGNQNINNNLGGISSTLTTLQKGVGSMEVPDLTSLKAIINQLPSDSEVATLKQELSGMNTLLNDSDTLLTQTSNLSDSVALLKTLPAQMTTLSSSLQQLQAASAKSANIATQLNSSVNGSGVDLSSEATINATINKSNFSSQIGQLVAGIQQYTSGVDTAASGASTLNANTPALTSASSQLFSAEGQLNSGASQLNSASGQLTSGGSQLTSASSQLVSGAGQLATGLGQLNGKVPALVSGVNQLVSGSDQVVAGGSQLTANSSKLVSGAGQLADGADQAQSGASQLADGSNQVQSGLSQVGAGVTTLNSKLADGAKQVSGLNTSTANVNHFVSPVKNSTQADNLNKPLMSVLAPLVIFMVLFIGAVLTELGFNRYSNSFQAQPLTNKLGYVGAAVVLQAIGIAVVTALMGVSMANPVAYLGFLILGSAVFTLIVFSFDRWWGTLGVLATLAILFVQLIISGGLLPGDMLSGLYQGLSAILPGTYLLNGLNYALNNLATGPAFSTFILFVFAAIFILPLIIKKGVIAPKAD